MCVVGKLTHNSQNTTAIKSALPLCFRPLSSCWYHSRFISCGTQERIREIFIRIFILWIFHFDYLFFCYESERWIFIVFRLLENLWRENQHSIAIVIGDGGKWVSELRGAVCFVVRKYTRKRDGINTQYHLTYVHFHSDSHSSLYMCLVNDKTSTHTESVYKGRKMKIVVEWREIAAVKNSQNPWNENSSTKNIIFNLKSQRIA